MSPVNSMDYSGKDTVLDVIRQESADFFNLVDDPNNWNVQTRCTEWEVRDMVGHMLDVTEGYLTRWESARNNEPRDTVGLLVMSHDLNEHAQAFRSLPAGRGDCTTQGRLQQNDGYLREADPGGVERLPRYASVHGSIANVFLSCLSRDGLWCPHLGYALGIG